MSSCDLTGRQDYTANVREACAKLARHRRRKRKLMTQLRWLLHRLEVCVSPQVHKAASLADQTLVESFPSRLCFRLCLTKAGILEPRTWIAKSFFCIARHVWLTKNSLKIPFRSERRWKIQAVAQNVFVNFHWKVTIARTTLWAVLQETTTLPVQQQPYKTVGTSSRGERSLFARYCQPLAAFYLNLLLLLPPPLTKPSSFPSNPTHSSSAHARPAAAFYVKLFPFANTSLTSSVCYR